MGKKKQLNLYKNLLIRGKNRKFGLDMSCKFGSSVDLLSGGSQNFQHICTQNLFWVPPQDIGLVLEWPPATEKDNSTSTTIPVVISIYTHCSIRSPKASSNHIHTQYCRSTCSCVHTCPCNIHDNSNTVLLSYTHFSKFSNTFSPSSRHTCHPHHVALTFI